MKPIVRDIQLFEIQQVLQNKVDPRFCGLVWTHDSAASGKMAVKSLHPRHASTIQRKRDVLVNNAQPLTARYAA